MSRFTAVFKRILLQFKNSHQIQNSAEGRARPQARDNNPFLARQQPINLLIECDQLSSDQLNIPAKCSNNLTKYPILHANRTYISRLRGSEDSSLTPIPILILNPSYSTNFTTLTSRWLFFNTQPTQYAPMIQIDRRSLQRDWLTSNAN